VVTDDERAEFVRLTKRARVNRAVAFRARIVLACIDASDTAVARRLRTTKTTVAKWRGNSSSAGSRGCMTNRESAPRARSPMRTSRPPSSRRSRRHRRRDALEYPVHGEGGWRQS